MTVNRFVPVHEMRTVTTMWRPLDPNEVLMFDLALRANRWPRICTCGMVVVGANEVDLYCNFKEHVAAVKAARG
jgi:hypothetical protein